MIDIENYVAAMTAALREAFGPRLRYVGLQGSYLRGEATEDSDIDLMVLLDAFTAADLDTYRTAAMTVGSFDKACGFLCGTEDLQNWNRLEACHVLHTTRDCYGRLADLIPAYTEDDVRQYVKMSLNNLYHELCHRRIYRGPARSWERLPGMYKSVSFILQNIHYLETGDFIQTKRDLLSRLEGVDRAVLETAMRLQQTRRAGEEEFILLFDWCKARIG